MNHEIKVWVGSTELEMWNQHEKKVMTSVDSMSCLQWNEDPVPLIECFYILIYY